MCHPVDPAFEYSDATERQLEMPGSGRTIPTFAYRYASEKRLPAVVIGHDVFGASPFYRDIARRLAEQGFATIVPELFCREGTLATHTMEAAVERAKRHNVLTALADLNSITAKLAEDGRKVGILGFCMGGRYALLAASRMPAVKASVVYYGSPIMSNERPDNPIVEVEQVHAPILGFFGEVDRGIPVQDVQHYQEVARKAGKEVDFTIYPGLGHAFFTFAADEPGSAASQESWAKAVLFLRARLGQGE